MNFNQPEEEFLDGDDVVGLGVLGKEGSGRLRAQVGLIFFPAVLVLKIQQVSVPALFYKLTRTCQEQWHRTLRQCAYEHHVRTVELFRAWQCLGK